MLIDKQLLDKVLIEARDNERLRKNYNFHDTLEAPSQRMLNVLCVGTVLPIHRHRYTSETYVVLKGKMEAIFYNDKKKITNRYLLGEGTDNYGINIPKGQWHTLSVLEKTVIFESKDGPFRPLTTEDILL